MGSLWAHTGAIGCIELNLRVNQPHFLYWYIQFPIFVCSGSFWITSSGTMAIRWSMAASTCISACHGCCPCGWTLVPMFQIPERSSSQVRMWYELVASSRGLPIDLNAALDLNLKLRVNSLPTMREAIKKQKSILMYNAKTSYGLMRDQTVFAVVGF